MNFNANVKQNIEYKPTSIQRVADAIGRATPGADSGGAGEWLGSV